MLENLLAPHRAHSTLTHIRRPIRPTPIMIWKTIGMWGGDRAWYDEEWNTNQDADVVGVTLDGGTKVLMKPKKPPGPKNILLVRETHRRGDVRNFCRISYRKGKGPGGRGVEDVATRRIIGVTARVLTGGEMDPRSLR